MTEPREVLAAHALAPWSDMYDWYCSPECGAEGSMREGPSHADHVLEALREAGYEVVKAPTPEQQLVTAFQAAVLKTCNGIGAALLGNSFTPLTESPIPDGELIRMFREASHDQ